MFVTRTALLQRGARPACPAGNSRVCNAPAGRTVSHHVQCLPFSRSEMIGETRADDAEPKDARDPDNRASDLVFPPPSAERFVDVSSLLADFNPLRDSHLVRWGSDDEEDSAVSTIALPEILVWEDKEDNDWNVANANVPAWVDYKDGSESESEGPSSSDGSMLGAQTAAVVGGATAVAMPNAYSAEAGFQEMSASELSERLATGQVAVLLDVRSRAEWEAGHVAGSNNVALEDLSEMVRSGQLEAFRDRPVAVVCASGMRSAQATVRLTRVLGFSHVTNVAGGMRAWAAEGLPVQVVRAAGGGGCGCGGSGGGSGGCHSKQQA